MGTGRLLDIFKSCRRVAVIPPSTTQRTLAELPPRNNLTPSASTFLIFDGLDTVASIDVCGKTIASTNNQFRQYTFDVSSITQKCAHNGTIDIAFTPGPFAASDAAKSANCTTCFGINYEFPSIQYLRKEQADFGWDFGPAYGPIGIWQSVRAVQLEEGDIYVENSAVDIYREGQVNNLPPDQSQPWVVNVTLDYLGQLAPGAAIQVRIDDMDGRTVVDAALSNLTTNTPGSISGQMLVTEPVGLWWPSGYGPQTLYNLTIQLQNCDKKALASVHKRTGFRTIVLDQRAISDSEIALGVTPGSKWNFQINGHEIWCKGSNMVPPDAFWPRVTEERIRDMFTSVVDGVRILSLHSQPQLMKAEPKHGPRMGRRRIFARLGI
jgi:beta-mannosidase